VLPFSIKEIRAKMEYAYILVVKRKSKCPTEKRKLVLGSILMGVAHPCLPYRWPPVPPLLCQIVHPTKKW
jgi:hypothetical protein